MISVQSLRAFAQTEEVDTVGLPLYASRKLVSSLSGTTPLSLSKGTVTILKNLQYLLWLLTPGAQANAPALEASLQGKNVKSL